MEGFANRRLLKFVNCFCKCFIVVVDIWHNTGYANHASISLPAPVYQHRHNFPMSFWHKKKKIHDRNITLTTNINIKPLYFKTKCPKDNYKGILKPGFHFVTKLCDYFKSWAKFDNNKHHKQVFQVCHQNQ